jgi:hypothetical protein
MMKGFVHRMKRDWAGMLVMSVLAVSLLSSQCSNPQPSKPNLEQQLIGNWEGVSTLLTINTEGRTARTRTISVSEGEWETKMNRTVPQMTYHANHSYQSVYVALIDPQGRQVRDTMRQSGTWTLRGDTLHLKEPQLSVPESEFKLTFKGNNLEISSMMDIDGDGEKDDSYWMLQRRK